MTNTTVSIGEKGRCFQVGNHLPMVVFAGPCVMEGQSHALECAHALREIADRLGINLVYKSSFDKACLLYTSPSPRDS